MRVNKLHGRGNHLIFDGFSEGDLGSCEFIRDFLVELVDVIDMNAISKPLVLSHVAENSEESGLTGTIILAESNITIHTYPKKRWFCLDVYSCKEFDVDSAISWLVEKLKIVDYKTKLLKRGFYEED